MSFIERLSESAITNIPDLINLHHSNPLGVNPLGLLIFIFIMAALMELVNFHIRYRDRSKFYPILYTLFGITLISIYYYCFMSDLPIVNRWGEKPCIGWFCDYDVVGDWGLTILGLVGLVLVVYWMICAVMQVTAEMSVHAGLSEGKKWKEWKWGTVVALAGLGASVIVYIAKASAAACSWVLLGSQIAMLLFCLVKLVLDCVRTKSAWGVAIALVFFLGIEAVIMLSIECMYGAIVFCVAILGAFASAKARKKKPKNKKSE
ncbi:MAG: hypothetical protein IKO34_01405 [Bacteroidales bacterium]|jgi:hypothetical protein|nr:hypothetical protein [Bacteroidales bacterium]MBR4582448.1 hypothetical protein [Bacteroidales bacterium]